MSSAQTFLWHDYETFGAHPQLDRPAQFAALRTDMDLQPVDEPISWYCKPAPDVWPHPAACLITGITPQIADKEGVVEAEFATAIHAEMMEPNTCCAGYNSIRFDDEFSRNLFYRNFIDPYEREYRNHNSRWDLIDLARMCYALRPGDISWPEHGAGVPSFRLEHLSKANKIEHEGAHEALSDVLATIGLARLIRRHQPRLFDWALQMRDQHFVRKMLNPAAPDMVLHSSSRIPAKRGCTTLVLPLSVYPERPKSVIAYDLMADPEILLTATAEQLHDRLFTPADDLPEGVERVALKAIHSNHVPMLAPVSTLRRADSGRIGLDPQRCADHADLILAALPDIRNKVMEVFQPYPATADGDPDHLLYAGGFFPDQDRRLMEKVRLTDPAQLGRVTWPFKDPRLQEMLFRFRARNFPETLDADEHRQWQAQCQTRLNQPADGRQLDFTAFKQEIHNARQQYENDGRAQTILDQLESWGVELSRAI